MKYLGEPLNGFAPNSHGRRVWSLAQMGFKVKVKGQCHQGQKRHFSALSAAWVQFMFGKTSLASSLKIFFVRHIWLIVLVIICLLYMLTAVNRMKQQQIDVVYIDF